MKQQTKFVGFSLVSAVLVLATVELLSAGAWQLLLRKAEATSKGVNVSRSRHAEPDIGFLLAPSNCTHYRYGLHDDSSYKAETPQWQLCTNSLGWRGPAFSVAKPARTFRIVCMGDSHTMGQGVSEGATYCKLFGQRLEPLIREHGLDADVINAGVWGHSSYQGLISYVKFVRNWQPDLVLVAYGANDRAPRPGFSDRLLYSLPEEEPAVRLTPYDDLDRNVVKVWEYGTRVFQEWRYARGREVEAWQGEYTLLERRATPLEYQENLERLIDEIESDRAGTVLLGIGIREQAYRDVLGRVSSERNVPLVRTWDGLADAEPMVRTGSRYRKDKDEIESWFTEDAYRHQGIHSRYITIDGGHPNKIGHQIIAEQLFGIVFQEVRSRLQETAASVHVCGDHPRCLQR